MFCKPFFKSKFAFSANIGLSSSFQRAFFKYCSGQCLLVHKVYIIDTFKYIIIFRHMTKGTFRWRLCIFLCHAQHWLINLEGTVSEVLWTPWCSYTPKVRLAIGQTLLTLHFILKKRHGFRLIRHWATSNYGLYFYIDGSPPLSEVNHAWQYSGKWAGFFGFEVCIDNFYSSIFHVAYLGWYIGYIDSLIKIMSVFIGIWEGSYQLNNDFIVRKQ